MSGCTRTISLIVKGGLTLMRSIRYLKNILKIQNMSMFSLTEKGRDGGTLYLEPYHKFVISFYGIALINTVKIVDKML